MRCKLPVPIRGEAVQPTMRISMGAAWQRPHNNKLILQESSEAIRRDRPTSTRLGMAHTGANELVQYRVLRQWSNKTRLKPLNPYGYSLASPDLYQMYGLSPATPVDYEVPYVDPEPKSISQFIPY